MTAVELFRHAHAGSDLRGLLIDGEPWFVSSDALALLDLNRSSIAGLDDDEKGVHTLDTPGGAQQVSIISESGLYSLILRSRKPEAKAIKRASPVRARQARSGKAGLGTARQGVARHGKAGAESLPQLEGFGPAVGRRAEQ